MNRELKFRVWNKRVNQYIDLDTGNYNFSLNELFCELQKNSVIQQYTGLKDVNGRDIYEGDILQRPCLHSDYIYKYVCEWSDKESAFMLRNDWNDIRDIFLPDFKKLEVIGNIFENKRILKFRVWDIKNKNFLSQSSTYYHIGDVTGIPYTLNEILNKPDRFIVQQFTELYDKNKKPIYEGDRVRFGYTGKVDFFGEVIWLEDRASFGVRTKNAFETFEDLMDYMKYFEVVGNIFQLPCNPDHNGECLVCDCWLSDCQFLNKEQQNYEKL